MKNYICINDVKTELTDKQVGELRAALGLKDRRLSEVPKKRPSRSEGLS